MLLAECSASTISGSIRFRDFCAFLIQRGGMFARNLKNPRTAEPELDWNSLASLGIEPRLLIMVLRNSESFSRVPHLNSICLNVDSKQLIVGSAFQRHPSQ